MFDHVDPHHDVAQVCRRGHLVNSGIQATPEYSKDFCPTCGQKTITACEHCGAPINGQWHGFEGFMAMEDAPAYCHKCGKPYLWTAEKIDAARALADELEAVDDADRIMLKASIEDLVVESPRTSVAVLRFKKIISKAKGAAKDLLLDLMAKIAVEAAKSQLGL
jgi:hypothetical protein